MKKDKSEPPKHGCYFRDGKRKAYFVLVYIEEVESFLTTLIENLQGLGLQIEVHDGKKVEKKFMLLHASDDVLQHLSEVQDIGLGDKKLELGGRGWTHNIFLTPLHFMYLTEKKGQLTSCARIMIMQKVLERVQFGDETNNRSVYRMIEMGLLDSAFPLHDGDAEYETTQLNDSHLNDRQLLTKYWASFSMWYKSVPSDAIERYYGSEIAYYFAWVHNFNLMLLIPSILGLLVVLFSIGVANQSIVVTDFMEKEGMVCPRCFRPQNCQFLPFSSYYSLFFWNYVFDNYLTVAYTILMSIWGTVGINLWKREWHTLQVKWGVTFDDDEIGARTAYIDRVAKKYDPKTKKVEPYVPTVENVMRMFFSISICVVMLSVVLLAVVGVITTKLLLRMVASEYLLDSVGTVVMIVGSILNVCFIKLFGQMYENLSIWLTDIENPRLQRDYDSSVLYKRYLLAFANNYAPFCYVAFVKGINFGQPGSNSFFTQQDNCQPSTCIGDLATNLFFIITFKRLVGNLLVLFKPPLRALFKGIFSLRKKAKLEDEELPQYEVEYELLPTNRYLLTSEFCEMVINYGFVTLFFAACPFASLFILLNNLMEQRLDATKLNVRYRRPIPRNVSGIGAWEGVIMGITYLSTATNAFIIAVSGDVVSHIAYKLNHWEDHYRYRSYANYTMSKFKTDDYDFYRQIEGVPEYCYYKGMREDPDVEEKYELDGPYWEDLTWRLIAVFVIEHFVLMFNSILGFIIPDYPKCVKDQLNLDRQLAKEAKMLLLKEEREENDINDEGERYDKRPNFEKGEGPIPPDLLNIKSHSEHSWL
nr:unnamed protein product [Callosobruchus analis]